MQHRTFFATILTGFFVLAFVGCNNPDSRYVRVTGTITYNGLPVEGATVTFMAVDSNGESGSGRTNANGMYVLTSPGAINAGTGVLPGEYTVRVAKIHVEEILHPIEEAYNRGEITYDEFSSRMAAMGPGAGDPRTIHTQLLPEKYGSHETELRATVNQGRNPSFDFDLTR